MFWSSAADALQIPEEVGLVAWARTCASLQFFLLGFLGGGGGFELGQHGRDAVHYLPAPLVVKVARVEPVVGAEFTALLYVHLPFAISLET